ncbi:MAG: GIY-YIG nuclease family protein [Dehalococcoidia bacterium]|nr:GIY-YIG nuclease family protein [Dehalococcoidia bacterium]
MSFVAYILRCADGSYYVGHAEDLEARLEAHQTGVLHGYTRSQRPVQLVWQEAFATRDEAFQAERRIKGWTRAKKEVLIRGDWSTLQLLARARGSTGLPRAGGGGSPRAGAGGSSPAQAGSLLRDPDAIEDCACR